MPQRRKCGENFSRPLVSSLPNFSRPTRLHVREQENAYSIKRLKLTSITKTGSELSDVIG